MERTEPPFDVVGWAKDHVRQMGVDAGIPREEIHTAIVPTWVPESYGPQYVIGLDPAMKPTEIEFCGATLLFTPNAVYVDGERLSQHWISLMGRVRMSTWKKTDWGVWLRFLLGAALIIAGTVMLLISYEKWRARMIAKVVVEELRK